MRKLVAVIALVGLALPAGATNSGTCYVESTDQGNQIICDDTDWIRTVDIPEPATSQSTTVTPVTPQGADWLPAGVRPI